MTKTKRLSPEALEVLRSGLTINETANTAVINAQLDRRLYVEVNDALAECGGKWDRRAKAHVFTGDPWHRLAEVIAEEGFTVTKQSFGVFYTPDSLADFLTDLAVVRSGMDVLEPSCGDGSLLRSIERSGASLRKLALVERDALALAKAEKVGNAIAGNVEAHCGDFLELAANTDRRFDRVVMNPPFALEGMPAADIRHVRAAFALLRPGGRLAAITSPGWTFRTNREHREFREFVERNGGLPEKIPAGAFAESGTGVATVAFVLQHEG